MSEELTCGKHRAYAYSRGGAERLFELTPLTLCRWNRIRDDISSAEVVIGVDECCGQLDDLRTILHELHIYRDDEPVWEGPMTRLEYEYTEMRIFAEDVLWQAKRTVIHPGYDDRYPRVGLVLDRFDYLLHQCYDRQGDPWNMEGHLHPVRTPGEPREARQVYNWQDTVWNEIDNFGEHYGVDYTVVNRDLYYWDIHWQWKTLPPLDEDWISEFPRIVEYGNDLATRVIVTDGRGHAGVDEAGLPATGRDVYGYVDHIINNANDNDTNTKPSDEKLLHWQETAARHLTHSWPSPVGIVVPDNTTLLPNAPWLISDLIPGAWFEVSVKRLCRQVSTWNRLQSVHVEEIAPRGETVRFSSVTAPRERHVLGL